MPAEAEHKNVHVMCADCKQRYVTSKEGWEAASSECPRRSCKSKKAQLLKD